LIRLFVMHYIKRISFRGELWKGLKL
jgi:hypothetical protein